MKFVQPIRERKQIEAMKKVLKGSSLRDYCLFCIGVNSGLRISDLLRLKVGDVRDSKGRIRDRISIKEKKTGKTKDFPLSGSANKAIAEYLVTRPNAEPNEALFLSRKAKGCLSRTRAWEILNEAARTVGISENIGTHTLRKTFAYHAYKQGKDIVLIQHLLNHSSPQVTLRYIGIQQDDLDRVYLSVDL